MSLLGQNQQNLIVLLTISGPLPHESLSERQRLLLRLMLAGWTIEQIAAELDYSNTAAKRARRSLLRRLGFSDIEDLTQLPPVILEPLKKLAQRAPLRRKK